MLIRSRLAIARAGRSLLIGDSSCSSFSGRAGTIGPGGEPLRMVSLRSNPSARWTTIVKLLGQGLGRHTFLGEEAKMIWPWQAARLLLDWSKLDERRGLWKWLAPLRPRLISPNCSGGSSKERASSSPSTAGP